MALIAAERLKVRNHWMRPDPDIVESDRRFASLTKADLLAAVGAVDDWCEANSAAFNTAIPQPARGALTASQKAILLAIVVMRRAGHLKTQED